MEVRRGNWKWLGARNRRAVGDVKLVVLLKFCARVEKCGGRHVSVGSKYGCRGRRGPIDGEKRTVGGELMANFFFLNVEEASDMLNHLLMGVSHLRVSRAVRGRRGDDVGSAASTIDGRG